jgi:type IV pilus assembly protein PilQ
VAALKSIALSTGPAGTELVLRVDGTYSYKAFQTSPDALFIDLEGAKVGGASFGRRWADPTFLGYKLLAYQGASGRPTLRIQVDTKRSVPFVVQKDASGLRLVFGTTQNAAATPASVTAPPQNAAVNPEPAMAPTQNAPSVERAASPSSTRPLPRIKADADRPQSSPVPSGATLSAQRTVSTSLASQPLLVSMVSLDKHTSDDVLFDVATSRLATYRVTTLPDPARLVIDIDDAQATAKQRSYAVNSALLKTVRIGQFRSGSPSIVRVVADLNGNPVHEVHATPAGIRIELHSRAMENSSPTPAQSPAPQPKPVERKNIEVASAAAPVVARVPSAAPKVEVASAAAPVAARVPSAAPKVEVASAAPPVVAHVLSAPPQSEVVDAQSSVAPPLQPGQDAAKPDVQSTLPSEPDGRQAVAAPVPNSANVTPAVLRAQAAAQVVRPGRGAMLQTAQEASAATPASPADQTKPVYTGEPISLNLKDVDLKDFFRLIHEISGLNIIIDPNVTGSVTLVLDSVPWDQALDIVLKDNELGKVMEGNVLRIARIQTLTAEQDQQTKLEAARLDAAPLVTMFRHLNYAKAAEVSTLLRTWVGGAALSRRGTVVVDLRGNTLIISDVQSQIPVLTDILNRIDKKVKQVSIEARVVLATADFTRLLATALYGTGTPGASTAAGMITNATTGIVPGNVVPQTAPAVTGFGTFAITNSSSRYLINSIISAQEERDQAKTISRPTIVTQNNMLGMVQQGVQIPVQTTINNTISVQYVNATLRLEVTPQITDENDIYLVINVNNASVGTVVANGNPSINTQQATTSVLIPDGGTVVFGGITVTSRSKSATYIPVLGNIPVLGHLFKTSNASDQDQELLFFVSPKILAG